MEAPYADQITLSGSLIAGGTMEDTNEDDKGTSDGEELGDKVDQTFRELLYDYTHAPEVPNEFLLEVERQVQAKLALYADHAESEEGRTVWQKIKGMLSRKSEKEIIEEKKAEWKQELKTLLTTNLVDQSLSDVSVEAVQDQLQNNPFLGFYQTLEESKDILQARTRDLSELLSPSIEQKRHAVEQLETLLSQLKAITKE